jgi:hypothetical protein
MPEPAKKLQAITRALPPDRQQTVTMLAPQVAQPAPVQSLTPVSAHSYHTCYLCISLGVHVMHVQLGLQTYCCTAN